MSEWRIINADVLDGLAQLDEQSVQCVVTSPPYWGLRDYGVDGQLGLEAVPDCLGWATGEPCGECYICHMVEVFRAVWRVLRNDGTCWVNMGDTYSSRKGQSGAGDPEDQWLRVKTHASFSLPAAHTGGHGKTRPQDNTRVLGNMNIKHKDMMMIPARLALALQADGWYLRSDIIWAKNNGMPESVTDRPSKSHEHIYLLTKKARYYFDQDAVSEPVSESTHARIRQDLANQIGTFRANGGGKTNGPLKAVVKGSTRKLAEAGSGIKANDSFENSCVLPVDKRNLRDVWQMNTQGYSGAHFATFPMELPTRCIKAGTSERGECPTCGKPWKKDTERHNPSRHLDWGGIDRYKNVPGMGGNHQTSPGLHRNGGGVYSSAVVTGWSPQCQCGGEPVPQIVLDPFSGAGTTILAANLLGRRGIGIELNPEYVAMSEKRIRDGYGATEEQLQGDGAKSVQMRMFS